MHALAERQVADVVAMDATFRVRTAIAVGHGAQRSPPAEHPLNALSQAPSMAAHMVWALQP